MLYSSVPFCLNSPQIAEKLSLLPQAEVMTALLKTSVLFKQHKGVCGEKDNI